MSNYSNNSNSFNNISSGSGANIPNITITDNTSIYYPNNITQLPYYPNVYPVVNPSNPNTALPYINNNTYIFDIVPEELLSLMKELDIPVGIDNKISVAELAAIFNDKEKLQLLITKLKNPAFR